MKNGTDVQLLDVRASSDCSGCAQDLSSIKILSGLPKWRAVFLTVNNEHWLQILHFSFAAVIQ